MNIYRNFNKEELLIAYNELMDNSGEINRDMKVTLAQRGYSDEFFEKANHKKIIVKEKGRIAFQVSKMVDQNQSFEDIEQNISSTILDEDELFNFILEKYVIFKSNHENDKVDKKTLYKNLIGLIIGTFAGISFLLLMQTFLKEFIFVFLIPTYIVCYLVIKKITGKTRDNLVVFISTFLATVLSAFISFLFAESPN